MEKFTAIIEDGVVIIDGEAYKDIDMFTVEPWIHAIQWKDGKGEVEGLKNGIYVNEPFTDITVYKDLIEQWENAKREFEAKRDNPFHGMAEADAKKAALDRKLMEIDINVSAKQNGKFYWNGFEYHIDPASILSMQTALTLEDSDNIIFWKTATKNGVSNEVAQLSYAEFEELYLKILEYRQDCWHEGDILKDTLKAIYADESSTVEDVMAFDSTLI